MNKRDMVLRRLLLKSSIIFPFISQRIQAQQFPEKYVQENEWNSYLVKQMSLYYQGNLGAIEIGNVYINIKPEEKQLHVLTGRLMERMKNNKIIHRGNIDKMQFSFAVEKQIIQDFELQNVVDINGWLLSETECQLCAIHAVSGKP